MTNVFLFLAKASILSALHEPVDINLSNLLYQYPFLQRKGAVFVTLTKGDSNRLRGCMGSIHASRPLYEEIIADARAAAFNDPRFRPLQRDELHRLHITVSLLTPLRSINYRSVQQLRNKIVPFQDGVVLSYQGHRATFLPQVWKQLPNFDTFFASLCQKAKLPVDCLKLHPSIQVYRVKEYKDIPDENKTQYGRSR